MLKVCWRNHNEGQVSTGKAPRAQTWEEPGGAGRRAGGRQGSRCHPRGRVRTELGCRWGGRGCAQQGVGSRTRHRRPRRLDRTWTLRGAEEEQEEGRGGVHCPASLAHLPPSQAHRSAWSRVTVLRKARSLHKRSADTPHPQVQTSRRGGPPSRTPEHVPSTLVSRGHPPHTPGLPAPPGPPPVLSHSRGPGATSHPSTPTSVHQPVLSLNHPGPDIVTLTWIHTAPHTHSGPSSQTSTQPGHLLPAPPLPCLKPFRASPCSRGKGRWWEGAPWSGSPRSAQKPTQAPCEALLTREGALACTVQPPPPNWTGHQASRACLHTAI